MTRARTEDPHAILGVPIGADEETIRAAWLRAVRNFPPERDAAAFERVRNAWDDLRDPRRRAERLLEADPLEPFVTLASALPQTRLHSGPEPWLEALKGGA